MKKRILFTNFLILLLVSWTAKAQDVLKYVDPNIGTAHSRWFFYTPAALPHGMAKLAPSTNGHYGNPSGWEAIGYDARDHSIEGFVNFHEWQIGGISVMPTTGKLKVIPGDTARQGEGYRSKFSRASEVAQPGYYKVFLDDYSIKAELTATTHVGYHKFTFPRNEESRVILDIGNVQGESGEVKDASVKMVDDTHFEGYVLTYPKYLKLYDPTGVVAMYFWGVANKRPTSVGSFSVGKIIERSSSAKGKGAGLFLNFKTQENEVVELKIGLSYTSIKNARQNFMAEAAHLTFDMAKNEAQKLWQHELSKIYVEGSNEKDKVKFYTGLFHALLGRGIANDVNGDYPLAGGKTGHLKTDKNGKLRYNFYNTDAIWGAYWNLTQVWALCYPLHYNDYVNTQLEMFENRGWFGDGIANSQFVSGVGTNFVGLAISAAYNCGIRDYNVNVAYNAIKKNELGWENRKVGAGKMDLKSFLTYGYVPYLEENRTDSSGSHFSASHTLEYSFSCFAAAQAAKSLGKKSDYKKLIHYSNGWRLLFNPKEKLIHPRKSDGSAIDNFNPYEPWRGFQEGNAIQYTYFVPQNPAALIQKIGKDSFNANLEHIFEVAQKNDFGGGETINAFSGISSIYNHGNEPNLQISWLFNFSGKPWLTQRWTRAICNSFYGTEPIHGYGYGQDEDQGQLGSWFVLAALGLFDVKGFTDSRPIIELGSPLFKKTIVQLGNGKKLEIVANNNSDENVYVQSVTLNNRKLQNCWLYRDELMRGGKMIFIMGKQPNNNWGAVDPPPSVQ